MNILIVEDSKVLRSSLADGLAKLGYAVDAVATGGEGLDFARLREYDTIILDLMLPDRDGLSVLKELRDSGKLTHVLILSARGNVEDRVQGLQLGADDYMIKPFSFEELCARIASLTRRKYQMKNPEVKVGKIRINTAVREVFDGDGNIMHLTPGEYSILEVLVLNRGRVLTLDKLMDAVHNCDSTPGPNVVKVMVCNLRKRLANAGEEDLIRTKRGTGYYITRESL